MPLHLTKVAFAIESVEQLADRLATRHAEGGFLTTRYLPNRAAEIEGGSLFWILKHRLVARSPILGFGEAEGGRVGPQSSPRARRAAFTPVTLVPFISSARISSNTFMPAMRLLARP